MIDYKLLPLCFITIFTQTEDKTVGNTDAETTLLNSHNAIGSLILPANILRVGSNLRFKIDGIYNDTGTPTATVRIKLGSTVLINSAGVVPANLTNAFFTAEFIITVKSIGVNGTCSGNGFTFIKATDSIASPVMRSLNMLVDGIINTTIENVFDVTYQWSAADAQNFLTTKNFVLEAIY